MAGSKHPDPDPDPDPPGTASVRRLGQLVMSCHTSRRLRAVHLVKCDEMVMGRYSRAAQEGTIQQECSVRIHNQKERGRRTLMT